MGIFYVQSDTHSCAALICRVGSMRGQQRREEGVLGEITNKETTFSFCCCTACLASSQVSPERVGSPLLLSSLLSLPNPHSYALSPNSQKATGEKKEERLEGGELLEQQQQELQESPKDAKRFGFADGSLRFNARELIFFFFSSRRKQEGGRAFFLQRMRRQTLPRLTKQTCLSWS